MGNRSYMVQILGYPNDRLVLGALGHTLRDGQLLIPSW